jgi:CheY-like chemotaxis protein
VQKAEQHPEPDLPSQEQPDALTTQARQLFFATTPEQLLAIWSLLQAIQAESSSNQQRIMLSQVCTHLQSLKYAASFPEVLPVWQLTSVTEGLAQQLVKHPGEITVKRIECIAAALQLLTELCRPAVPADLITAPPIRLMVVDDDLISRRAIAHALAKAFRQPDIASNGEAALAQISKISYDVIFLDILMPGLDGFELNTKIRETSVNQFTPVVFVTSQSDALTRERAELCCGDLIIKPFLTFEITLTAMVLATRARFNTLRKDLTGESVKQEHARTAQAELVESVA